MKAARRSTENRRGPHPQRGFTLLEVIVALVITSLLVAVLVGALYYVFRVQDALRSEVVERELTLRARTWFVEALRGCLPAEANTPSAFAGSTATIRCETTTPLKPRRLPAPERISFSLRRQAGAMHHLEYREERDGAAARTVAAWNADDVQFRYVDDAGEERQDWPPSRAEPETLPRLVKLVVKHAGGGETVWLTAPGADPWLPPKPRGNPFGVELPR